MVVARESYALTVYTLWHLQQLERHQAYVTTLGDHDRAQLAAFAFNKPGHLPELRAQFLDRNIGPTSPDDRARRLERLARMIAAHKTMVPVDPPASPLE